MNRTISIGIGALVAALAAPAAGEEPTKHRCVEANTRGQELRQAGKFKAAATELAVCSVASCPAAVRTDCTERLEELRKATPKVTFAAKTAEGASLDEVSIAIDGGTPSPLGDAAISFDLGLHTIELTAAGRRSIKRELLVHEGMNTREELVFLNAPTTAGTSPSAAPAASAPVDFAPPPLETARGAWSTQRIVGAAIAGAGLITLGIGGILGLGAKSRFDESAGKCSGNFCTSEGLEIRKDAVSGGNTATVVFVIGAVALVGGAVLWLVAPSRTSSLKTAAITRGVW